MPVVKVWDVLARDEAARAWRIGAARYDRARELGRSQPFGDPGTPPSEQRNQTGQACVAELLVARYLDLPWVDDLRDDLRVKPADVGDDIEVRWTAYEGPTPYLIGHVTDNREWLHVLVQGTVPDMRILGWTHGAALMQPEYQANPLARNAHDYWMPARELLMPDLLLPMAQARRAA